MVSSSVSAYEHMLAQQTFDFYNFVKSTRLYIGMVQKKTLTVSTYFSSVMGSSEPTTNGPNVSPKLSRNKGQKPLC